MLTADFDYALPPELIAQTPAPQRDQSRLLVLHRDSGAVAHRQFPALLEYLQPGDVLVLNNSRVIPARLRGRNARTGGAFEIFLLAETAPNDWWCLMKPGKRAPVGTEIKLETRNAKRETILATVLATNAEGHRCLRFTGCADLRAELDTLGEIPLPPYIRRDAGAPASGAPSAADRERYQTVYAQPPGSVAAPTAGLHFTAALLADLRARGVQVCFVTLHVGLGTFAPVKADTIAAHTMHEERYELSAATAATLNAAKAAGRRVVAVGTTSVRVLESVAAQNSGQLAAATSSTRIFIFPPYQFRVVDALLTNFHLPCSTLLMLVSAFAAPGETRGRETILAAYAEAIRERYRFFSYGDAMLLL